MTQNKNIKGDVNNMHSHTYKINIPKGGCIALHRSLPLNPIGLPIIIAHGTMSNADTVSELAKHLCALGFDCWSLEWGGHGDSQAFSKKQNFEHPAFHDVPLAIQTVLQESGHAKAHWLAHSGGGHLALMHLARNPSLQGQLASLVTLGAQATDGAIGLKYKSRAILLWFITKTLGHFPKSLASVGTEGEPTQLLAQWATWNISEKWRGTDGFDYLQSLNALTLPALIMAGGNDNIAPPSGCKKIFTQLGSVDKSWQVCSIDNGFSKDFSHGQLIRGSAAKKEIFVKITEWLQQRNQVNPLVKSNQHT
jgi:pimeloyl-ACP methyl ester carboxylesterase